MITFILFIALVNSHGLLVTPMTRRGNTYLSGASGLNPIEDDPVAGPNSADFVCRHTTVVNSGVTLTAGGKTTLMWDVQHAPHVGDCDVYLSYEPTAPRETMKWFKIANLYDCRLQSQVNMEIDLPDWIPSGQAVLRWGWYAVHRKTAGSIEFYAQCSDVTVVGTETALPADIVTYPLINPAVFPSDAVAYPERFGPIQEFVVGPACAMAFAGNDCYRTAAGTAGHIAIGGSGTAETTSNPGLTTTSSPGTTVSGTSAAPGSVQNRCGTDWDNAQANCGQVCPGGTNSECPNGQSCFADITPCIPASSGAVENRCGSSWTHATTICGAKCPGGVDSECPGDHKCFADIVECVLQEVPTADPVVTTQGGVEDSQLTGPPGNCPTSVWISINVGVDSQWCQDTCKEDMENCDDEVCVCDLTEQNGDEEEQTGNQNADEEEQTDDGDSASSLPLLITFILGFLLL